jgi:hypothetical protein
MDGQGGYPGEFRRRVLDLLEGGRTVSDGVGTFSSVWRRSTRGGATKIGSTAASASVRETVASEGTDGNSLLLRPPQRSGDFLRATRRLSAAWQPA